MSFASDIIEKIPGFRVVGVGPRARVVDARGQVYGNDCPASIVVNGAEYFGINDVAASEIGAIEAYKAGPPAFTSAPMEYDHGCGVIVIWTKR